MNEMNCHPPKTNRLFSSLCQYQIQKEYDTTISLYDGEDDASPVCSHHTKGRAMLPLWKLAVALGAIAVFLALMRGMISLFSLFSD